MRDSKIILSKKMLMDKNYKNVLNFTNEQILNIMQSNEHLVGKADDYSFIKESTNTILVNFTYNQCLTANYIAFQNPRYSSKWFFSWIDSVEYYSEKATKITFTIDNWSTWFENLEFKTAYVLREHVNDDTIGKHIQNENLAVEKVISEEVIYDSELDSNFYVAVTSNWNIDNKTGYNGISAYTGTVFGDIVHLFDLSESGLYNLDHFIFITNGQGHVSDIHDMFIVPKVLIPEGNYENKTVTDTVAGTEVTCTYKRLRYDSDKAFSYVTRTHFIEKLNRFSDFVPKNNKVFTYPYNYLFVTNNVGSSNIYKYEDFNGETGSCDFQIQMALSIGGSARIVPLAYKGEDENVSESLVIGKYPTCSWSADSYTNWLTENAVNIGQSIISSGVSLVKGDFGNLAGQVGNLIGGFYTAQLLPEITGGQAVGDVNYASKNAGINIIRKRASTECLKVIDDYFTRFGYKIDRIKIPNITGRQNFNYIEIGQGENFAYGEVPANSLYEINQIARNGVTIWHNHENIGNYDVSNNIV